MRWLLRSLFSAALLFLAIDGYPRSAIALDQLALEFPLLQTQIKLDLENADKVGDLLRVHPDLVELDQVTNGSVKALLERMFKAPLPLEAKTLLEGADQPLLEQALRAATYVVEVEGLPSQTTGRMLADALIRANRNGSANLLGLLREIPGEVAVIDFSKLTLSANRLRNQLQDGVALTKTVLPAPVTSSLRTPLRRTWQRLDLEVNVPERSKSLRVLTLIPEKRNSNGRLVVISHGLWDEAASFEGWGELLAAYGYTVLLPDHPGSDSDQQKAMLAGELPPPQPEELRLRPLDVTALLNAIESGEILQGYNLNVNDVAVAGHSWGALTALQLIGAQTTDRKLLARCGNPDDSERNLSWVLQCSWLSSIEKSSLADSRIKTAVAVSPPLRLLFDPELQEGISGKVLLVSGTRDWVVPSGPEALTPMRNSSAAKAGHRLVLVERGDHFNLRAPSDLSSPAVLAPLILAWVNEQLSVPSDVTFTSGGWGDERHPLFDVTDQL